MMAARGLFTLASVGIGRNRPMPVVVVDVDVDGDRPTDLPLSSAASVRPPEYHALRQNLSYRQDLSAVLLVVVSQALLHGPARPHPPSRPRPKKPWATVLFGMKTPARPFPNAQPSGFLSLSLPKKVSRRGLDLLFDVHSRRSGHDK